MDDSLAPDATDFVILADGVPKVPSTASWFSATQFQVTLTEPSLSPLVVRLQLPAAVADFRDATLHLVFPFDILAVEV